MRVTFLGHSGFLVESNSAALLFDWWKGELPAVKPGVPLYIFASHAHPDHFDPKIFSLDDGGRDVRFVLGHDVKPTPRNCSRWGVSPSTAENCRNLRGGETLDLPGAKVEALPSTDEGEAFLVTLPDGQTVFHAGDLNWWHWEGEDKGWNRNMEVNFKRYAEPLRGRRLDLAMLPLDPRLGEAGFWGPAYFLETAEIRRFLPMHQWGISLSPGNFWKNILPLQTARFRWNGPGRSSSSDKGKPCPSARSGKEPYSIIRRICPMYAVGIVGLVFLLLGILLLTRHANSPMLIAGLICVLIGIVLSRISRANRRR